MSASAAHTNGFTNGLDANGVNCNGAPTTYGYDGYFVGKKIFVTGVGKGIGKALAKELCRVGANVWGLSENQGHLDELLAEEPRIQSICVDLCDWEKTREKLEALPVTFDGVVNNAGITFLESFLKVTKKSVDLIFDVNVKAVINVSQVLARKMVEDGVQGSIVNISSQCGLVALPEHTVYCGSKSAVDSITRVMALELGDHQIRVNSICPTVVMTDMGRKVWVGEKAEQALEKIVLHKFAEEIDIVDTVFFLLSNRSRMITGHALPVDGGWTIH